MSNNGNIRIEPPPQPQAENAKWCHRFFIPMTFAEQRPNPLNPREMMVEPKAQGVFVKCLGNQCSLWDDEKNQCGDKTQAQATAKLAELKDKEFRITQIHAAMEGVGAGEVPQL